MKPDLESDPFGEHHPKGSRRRYQLLGGRFDFHSNSEPLLRIVDAAYAGLPQHRLSAAVPEFAVSLQRLAGRGATAAAAAPLNMLSGAGFVGGATAASSFVVVAPRERTALVGISAHMMHHAYHVRYESIEFAVFMLAARVQGLVPLHGACVGRAGRGLLLMGASGSGKSTLALFSLLHGLDFLAEDSVFVAPGTMLATGVPNYLHVRNDSLRWLGADPSAAIIRSSPVIRRRSGVRKFEVDLRSTGFALAPKPLRVCGVIFLSPRLCRPGSPLRRLSKRELRAGLQSTQAYAAHQPGWSSFCAGAMQIPAFELRRGPHPNGAVQALKKLLAQ